MKHKLLIAQSPGALVGSIVCVVCLRSPAPVRQPMLRTLKRPFNPKDFSSKIVYLPQLNKLNENATGGMATTTAWLCM
ncbi:MAG: hypothetical protein NZ534_02550, partial [Bacteroidia bacterium]|nr:hypothetical protein [Bacteroidia bacterium]